MATVYDVTEKVEARIKIEEAEKKYRNLLETLPVSIFTVDQHGCVNFFNQATEKLWGRMPVMGTDHWVGSDELLSLDKKNLSPDETPLKIALRENRSFVTELYHKKPNGELRHVIAHPQPIHNIDGEVIGGMNVLIDITEIKAAAAALRTSEIKYRLLADALPQLIWNADAGGNLNYFSQSVFNYSGLSPEQIHKDGWLQIVHPDDREKNIEKWKEAITSGKDFLYEHRFRNTNGEYRWQLSRAVPQIDDNGKVQMWVGSSTDIHEQKLFSEELEKRVNARTRELIDANAVLKKSETRYHLMVEEVQDYAILYLDRKGIVENWKAGAEKIKGYKAEEIIGKSFSNFYTEEDRKTGFRKSC